MGRKKLAIEKIENPESRNATFYKRQKGLMSKARQLSVLCDIDVAVILFSEGGKLFTYCNHNNIADILTRFVAAVMSSSPDGRMDSMSEVQENLRKLAARLNADRDSEVSALGVELADLQRESLRKLAARLESNRDLEVRVLGVELARKLADHQRENLRKLAARLNADRDLEICALGVEVANLQRENQALKSNMKKLYAEKTIPDMEAIDTETIAELFESAQKVYVCAKQLKMQADEAGLMTPQPAAIAENVDEKTGLRPWKGVQNCNSRQTKIGRTSSRLNNGVEVESLPGKGVRNYNSGATKMREISPSFSSNGIDVESRPCQSAQNLNSGATQVGQARENVNNGTTPRKVRKILPRPSAQQNFVFNQMLIDAYEAGLMAPQPAAIAENVDEKTGLRPWKGVQNCNSRQTKIGRTSSRLDNGVEVESLPEKGVRNYNSGAKKMRETSPSFSSDGIDVESRPCQNAQNLNSGATQVGQARKNVNNGTTPRKVRKILPRPSAQQNFVFNQMQIDVSVPLTESLQNFNSGRRHIGDSTIPIEETVEYESRSVGHGNDFEALRSPSLYLNFDGGNSTASRCFTQQESPGEGSLRRQKLERSQVWVSGFSSA